MSTNGPRQQIEARIAASPPTASAVELDLELEFSGDIRSFLLAVITVGSVHKYGVKYENQINHCRVGRSRLGGRGDDKVLSTFWLAGQT